MRDADGLRANFSTGKGFDCADRDSFCESDFDSPVTTLIPSSFGLYPADARIRYVVSDDYPASSIKTYFCLSSGSCYPTATAQGAIQVSVGTSGSYNLYYYSEDPAKNLEVVRKVALDFDAEPPIIDLISPANASDFPTNQQNFTIKLKTAPDARYLCANNTLTRQTQCFNSCSLAAGNCIPSTGMLDITIHLGGATGLNATRNIVLYSEDFAGNKYQNTMMGIMLDIEPPRAPVIYIV
jgi:hypothetical protein